MSWLYQLYETYEKNSGAIGQNEKRYGNQTFTLLPVSHTTQNAHIEVVTDEDGDFLTAKVLEKENTLIPATEDSASRSGAKIAPYPLHDKLVYVAGDFEKYGGKVKEQKNGPFETYINNLREWVESSYSNKRIKAIYNYLQKGSLIADLVENGILVTGDDGLLIDKWNKAYEKKFNGRPAIFSSGTTDQFSAFVRFTTYNPTGVTVWEDKEVYESFSKYYEEKLKENSQLDFCYVTGKEIITTERHANKIRHAADKAKLISSNDSTGFTYRGKFAKSGEVAAVGYDVSQKAHNALKWLINRQGTLIDNRAFVVWAVTGEDNKDINDSNRIPSLLDDTFNLVLDADEGEDFTPTTDKPFAIQFRNAITGYKNNLKTNASVNILILDSATTGRMGVLYYRHLKAEQYIKRVEEWHETCKWEHRYRKVDSKFIQFEGAPSPRDIAFAAYGGRANEKLVKALMERIAACIIDRRNIPNDIVKSAFNRSVNPISMEKWEWEKTFSITCALIRRSLWEKKEEWGMSLDENVKDRSYLFGRLLAVADVFERNALDKDENRATNAIRYMNSFAQQPARTWKIIYASLQPYEVKLGKGARRYTEIIDEILAEIDIEDMTNKSLTAEFLLGLSHQRKSLYTKKEKGEKKNVSAE